MTKARRSWNSFDWPAVAIHTGRQQMGAGKSDAGKLHRRCLSAIADDNVMSPLLMATATPFPKSSHKPMCD
jgi:hypothetical protein